MSLIITQNDILFSNITKSGASTGNRRSNVVYTKKDGSALPARPGTEDIEIAQTTPFINAIDIDWNGAQLMNGEDVIATINTSGELISILSEYQNIQKSNSTDTLYLLASTSSKGGYEKVYVPGSLTLKKGILYINDVRVTTITDLTNAVKALNDNMNAAHTELETSINAIDKEVKKIGSGKFEKTINVAYVDADNNYVGTNAHIDLVVSYANGNINEIKFECPCGPLASKDYVDYFIAEVREPQATETSYGTVKLFNGDVDSKDASYYTSYAIATGAGHKHGNYTTKSDLSNVVSELETSINTINSEVNKIGSGTVTSYVNIAYIDEANDYIHNDGHIDLSVSYANGNLTGIRFESHHGPLATQDYVDYIVGSAIEPEATETSYGVVKLFKGDVDSQKASYYTSYAVAVSVSHTHSNYATQDYVNNVIGAISEPQATETSYGIVKLFNGDVDSQEASYYTSYAVAVGVAHKHNNYVTQSTLTNAVISLHDEMNVAHTELETSINAVNNEVKKIGSGKIEKTINVAYADADNDYVGTDAHLDLVVSYANGNINEIKFECPRGPLVSKDYVDYFIGEVREPQATETSYGTVKLFNGNVDDKDASYYTSYAIATGAGHTHGNYEDKLNKLRGKINEIITYFNANITLIDEFNW